jgi:hypothetical protein
MFSYTQVRAGLHKFLAPSRHGAYNFHEDVQNYLLLRYYQRVSHDKQNNAFLRLLYLLLIFISIHPIAIFFLPLLVKKTLLTSVLTFLCPFIPLPPFFRIPFPCLYLSPYHRAFQVA